MTAAALAYLVAGFSVVATAMGTKRPLFPWIEFQSRRPTAAEMSAWYRRDPRAGVAIVCDAVGGRARGRAPALITDAHPFPAACRVPNSAKRLSVVQRPKSLFESQRSMTSRS